MFIQSCFFLYSQLLTNKIWLERLKWIANAFVIISAAAISFSTELAITPPIFFGFLIAHIMWVFAGIIMKDKPIITLNAFFVIIDIYAIIIRL